MVNPCMGFYLPQFDTTGRSYTNIYITTNALQKKVEPNMQMVPLLTFISQNCLSDSDRPNVWFGQTVWPNFYWRFDQNDRTFFCRTQNFFFVLYSMASFHIFVLLNDPHGHCVIIGLQVKQPKECQKNQNWNKKIILT